MVTATDGFLTPNGAAMFWQGSQHKVEPRRKQYGCRIPYCLSILWPENYKVFSMFSMSLGIVVTGVIDDRTW